MPGLSSPICCCSGDGATTNATSGVKFIQTVTGTHTADVNEANIIWFGLGSTTFAPSEIAVGTTIRATIRTRSSATGGNTAVSRVKFGGVTLFSSTVAGPAADAVSTLGATFTFQSIGAAAIITGPNVPVGTTVDSTATLALEITGQISATGAGLSVALDFLTIEVLNPA